MLAGEFEMAVAHLERGRSLIEEQRARIARLETQGGVPATAIQLLIQLEQTMDGFEYHFRLLQAELAEEALQIEGKPSNPASF